MRHFNDRRRDACSSRRQTTLGRLSFESLEVRTMLSAEALTSDLVEFSKAAVGPGGGGITPAEIRAAYGFNNVSFGSTAANGAGQTIAIVDSYNDPNIASDLATFDNGFGIAAPPSFKVVNQSGGTSLPGTSATGGWEVETSLDVEWAHAVAPAANIVLVEANDDSDNNLFAAVNYARQQAGVSVISMSWGSDDTARDASGDQSLAAQYLVTPSGHQGVTFVAASGDFGVPTFPSTSPNVLAVGGTDLNLSTSGSIISETAWEPQLINGTTYSGGGGVSQEFSGRKVPDVAYDAGVGYDVYDSFTGGGGWIAVGGTSAGSPQWAGLVAIADQGRVLAGQTTLNGATQTIPALYAAESDFTDISTGSTQFETAGVGYDLATGLGSPKANLLIPYLASYGTSGGGTTTTAAPAAPASVSATANSTSSVTVNWSGSTGATGYDLYELENGSEVLINTYSSSATSAGVSGLSASTTYSFQVAAYNSGGTSAATSAQVTTPAAAVVVTAPQNPHVTATSSTTATVSWQAVTGATGYQVYQWNGSAPVLINALPAGSTSANLSGLAAGSTQYFYVTAYNATSSASTAWLSVVMPKAATPTLAAPVLTATDISNTAGKLSWTASSGETGYEIYYMNGTQAVALGSVGPTTTSVTISGMAPGTTYEFMVQAYNRTSQASSQWAPLTTTGTAANTRAAITDTAGGLTLTATAGSSVATVDASSALLPAGVTFNQAAANGFVNNSVSSALSASVFSGQAAVDSLVQATVRGVGATTTDSLAGESFNQSENLGFVASVGNPAGTALKFDLGQPDFGLSQTWDNFAAASTSSEASTEDRDTASFGLSLVESLDTLFGRDIEWAETELGDSQPSGDSTSATSDVSESESPSTTLLVVGLALSALWSEGDRLRQSAESEQTKPRRSELKRRQINP